MRKELLAGLSALAFAVAVSGTALADGVNVGNDNDFGAAAGIGGGGELTGAKVLFGNGDAVAGNALQQVTANALAGDDINSNFNSQLADQMHFGPETFKEQRVVVNNFNTAVNVAQQGAIAVAGTFNAEGAGPGGGGH